MQTNAYTEETQAVLNQLAGYRTKEQVVCEFFGVKPEDLGKTVKLKKAEVQWHDRLAALGLSKETFIAMFRDTLELDSNGKLIDNGRIEPVKADAGASEERGGGDEAVVGVEAPVKPLVRRKKAGAEKVPGTEQGAQ